MQSIKKVTKKDFAQRKTFDNIGRKTILSIRLKMAVFCGCKNTSLKKCYLRKRCGFTDTKCNTCKILFG